MIVKYKLYHVQYFDRLTEEWQTISDHYLQLDAMIDLGRHLGYDGDTTRYRVVKQAEPVVLIETKTPDCERAERPEESI